jgi:hypothetical protein
MDGSVEELASFQFERVGSYRDRFGLVPLDARFGQPVSCLVAGDTRVAWDPDQLDSEPKILNGFQGVQNSEFDLVNAIATLSDPVSESSDDPRTVREETDRGCIIRRTRSELASQRTRGLF